MDKKDYIIGGVILVGLVASFFVGDTEKQSLIFGAPSATGRIERSIVPETDSTYYLGTTTPSTRAWKNIITDEICLAGDCQTTWSAGAGEANIGANLGTGLPIYDTKSGVTLRFNSIAAGSNITLSTTTNDNTIVIASTASGGGTGTVSTSTNETAGRLSYWTSNSATPALLGEVATTTLTASSPLSLSNPVVKVGGSNSTLTLDTSGTWSGNAGTASALAANGSNCTAGSYALGVDENGAAEDCTDATTEISSLITSAFPWTPSTAWGLLTNSTTTQIQIPQTLLSSSTIGRLTTGTITATSTLTIGGTTAYESSGDFFLNKNLADGDLTIGDENFVNSYIYLSNGNYEVYGAIPKFFTGDLGQGFMFGAYSSSATLERGILDFDSISGGNKTFYYPNWSGEVMIATSTSQVSSITSTSTATSTYVGGISTNALDTSATSTLAGLRIDSQGLTVSTLLNCNGANVLETDSAGNLQCGSDAGASGTVTSVTNSDGTLTISPTDGDVVASLNLGNVNTWTAEQRFHSATSTLFASASSTIGNLTVGSFTATSTISLPASSVTNTMLQNSTISGISLGGTLGSLSNDSTLSGTAYDGSGAVSDWGLNLANPNIWTGQQRFSYASSTLFESSSTTIGNLTAGTITATSSLTIIGLSDGCLNVTSGVVGSTGSACGSGGGTFSWTPTTNYGTAANATTTPIWFQNGFQASTTNNYIESLILSGTSGLATSTILTDLQIGAGAIGNNKVRITADRNYSNSNSVGGLLSLINTSNNGPALMAYTNQASSNGNLVNFRIDNNTFAHDGVKIDYDGTGDGLAIAATAAASNALSLSNTGVDHTLNISYTGSTAQKGGFNVTSTNTGGSVFQISGVSAGLGIGKISHTGVGDADASILSLAASDTGYLGQGIFLDMETAGAQKLLNLRADTSEKLTLLSTGQLGISSTSPSYPLSVVGEGFLSATTTTKGLQVYGGTGTSTAYIYSKTAGFGGQIIMEDSGGGACTKITTSAGELRAVAVTCPTEI